jgi:hypothetical protein
MAVFSKSESLEEFKHRLNVLTDKLNKANKRFQRISMCDLQEDLWSNLTPNSSLILEGEKFLWVSSSEE